MSVLGNSYVASLLMFRKVVGKVQAADYAVYTMSIIFLVSMLYTLAAINELAELNVVSGFLPTTSFVLAAIFHCYMHRSRELFVRKYSRLQVHMLSRRKSGRTILHIGVWLFLPVVSFILFLLCE